MPQFSTFKRIAKNAVSPVHSTVPAGRAQNETNTAQAPPPPPESVKRTASSLKVAKTSQSVISQPKQISPVKIEDVSSPDEEDDNPLIRKSSSEEDAAGDVPSYHRRKKKGHIFRQKWKRFKRRFRSTLAMWDTFIVRGEDPPFVVCLQVSAYFLPILLILCIWDTLALVVFEVPALSSINNPGFILGWHFVAMMLSMYGFMLSYLSSGMSPRTKAAAIALGIHYLLLFYRVFMEIYFNGFRGESKLYYERTKKIF